MMIAKDILLFYSNR